jgi:hypothetical protein
VAEPHPAQAAQQVTFPVVLEQLARLFAGHRRAEQGGSTEPAHEQIELGYQFVGFGSGQVALGYREPSFLVPGVQRLAAQSQASGQYGRTKNDHELKHRRSYHKFTISAVNALYNAH